MTAPESGFPGHKRGRRPKLKEQVLEIKTGGPAVKLVELKLARIETVTEGEV